MILSKVKLSLKSPSASLVSLSPPPEIPSSRGELVCVPRCSTIISDWPLAVTLALSRIRALVVPKKTAAPTAPASALPPVEKLAAGSSIKISVSSPACTCTDPSVVTTELLPMVALVVDFTRPTDTEPAPASPPDEPAIPTTVAVKF